MDPGAIHLAVLDALSPKNHLAAFHATRADLLAGAGHRGEAFVAFTRAAELEPDPTAAAYLRARAADQRGGSLT